MNRNLELLSLAKKFRINKKDKEYEIEYIDSNLAAKINDDNKITYYITGCYDSGCDWIDFNEKQFEELKQFCELMLESQV